MTKVLSVSLVYLVFGLAVGHFRDQIIDWLGLDPIISLSLYYLLQLIICFVYLSMTVVTKTASVIILFFAALLHFWEVTAVFGVVTARLGLMMVEKTS